MNLVDCYVEEVLKVERLDNTMDELEWLKEPVNAYTVKYISYGRYAETEIWIKVSEDKGQVKKGYKFMQ